LDAVAATRARVAATPGRLDGATHGGRALDGGCRRHRSREKTRKGLAATAPVPWCALDAILLTSKFS